MTDINYLLKDAILPLSVGNILVPLRACIKALREATHLEKRCLYAALLAIVDHYGAAMTVPEVRACKELLESFTEQGPLDSERRALLTRLEGISPSSLVETPGRVNLLFTSNRPFHGLPFGLVQPLEIVASPWRGNIELCYPKASSETMYNGFHLACRAALDFLLTHGLGQVDGLILLNGYRIEGHLPGLDCSVEGESLGLGTAVAVVSRLLDIAVPTTMAFTGRIDLHGNLYGVGGIPAKLEAAEDKGIRQGFLPGTNWKDIPQRIQSHLDLKPVETLRDVVEAIFPSGSIERGVARLKELPMSYGTCKHHWRVVDPIPSDATRVLFTVVGKSDPIGTLKDKHGEPIGKQDGPILTLCRDVRPQHIFLFYTIHGEDFTESAEAVKQFLESEDPACSTRLVPLKTVLDPTELSQLIPAFQSCVSEILRLHLPTDSTFFVNATSGTPQMLITWHVLRERGLLPGRLLQIREGRYVPDGESRVRQVVIPA